MNNFVRRRRGRRHPRAFTLVEMVAVGAVLVIVAAVAAPDVVGGRAAAGQAAAATLASDLVYARDLAVMSHAMTYVAFDATAGTYALYDVPPTAGATPIANRLTGGGPYRVTLPSGVGLAGVVLGDPTDTVLCFDETGAPSAGPPGGTSMPLSTDGTVTVSAGYLRVTISVGADTGEVDVQ